MLFHKHVLLDRRFLMAMLVVNGLGTIYGYEWYRAQLIDTWNHYGQWLVLFVPDSPTASLFFTLSLFFLLKDVRPGWLRGIIEALAVVTSIKYGFWAVAMIAAGGLQGDPLEFAHYMLVVSHLGMALEALLYARWMTYRFAHVAAAAAWTLTNDWIDYTYGVFPALPRVLHDDLWIIAPFTVALGLLGIGCACLFLNRTRKNAF